MKRYASALLLLAVLPCFLVRSSSLVEAITNTTTSRLSTNQTITMLKLSKALSTILSSALWNSNSNPNPCSWKGVICSSGPPPSHVTRLSLSGLGLSSSAAANASIFSLLCELDSLQYLDLSDNSLVSLPSSFLYDCSGLSGLKYLKISLNKLSGPLPKFSGFPKLESLDLSYNLLQGAIDSKLDALLLLKSLNLSYNDMNGPIPKTLSSSLEELVLSLNGFVGQIPDELFNHGNLTVLDLRGNMLSGSIPDGIKNLSKLERLVLSSNRLSGVIPGNISMIQSLSLFAANTNAFNGSIPSGITKHLRFLDLSYNGLSGELPPELLSYSGLEHVDLTENRLQGSIPVDLSPRLYRLRLSHNNLHGPIPPAIGELSGLVYLELDNNELDGKIPASLGNCTKMSLLNLATNRLQGMLPKELGNLTNLVVLKLQMNNLNGSIPDEIFKLVQLSNLNFGQNLLSGEISPSISNLVKLANLNLDSNKFSGSIPGSINAMMSLIELQLGNNKLNGTIPKMPRSLEVVLNLSSNQFTGPLPSDLASLDKLEVLDISNNEFNGSVPYSFVNMGSLRVLVISNNQLSGTLPVFHRGVNVIFSGNKNLLLPNASSATPSKSSSPNVLVIVVVLVFSVVVLGLLGALLFFIVSRRYYRVEDEGLQVGQIPQVINGCYLTSNSIHRSNIDFRKAMEAIGDPNNILLKTRFSTYYKSIMPSGASYTVKKLNWGDKIFQSGNHKRFEQELEVLGRLSNSNVMVPLAYVLAQDSAYLFYESVHRGTVFEFLHRDPENGLDWPSRYSIALGVAQGLTFLHGCTEPVILLDLSTKSIHLKSLKEPQIGDIELCKVIDPSKSTESLTVVAGSVGYIPPEYAYTMRVTMAGNVYSFGVVLLELLTGKPSVSEGIELAKWALSCSTRLNGKEYILDSSLGGSSPAVRSQMLSVLKVALSCVRASPEERPSIRNVLRMLFNAT